MNESPLLCKRYSSEEAGEQIHTTHHLDRTHAIVREQLPLPIGGEAVK
jgi:hypothetical protein